MLSPEVIQAHAEAEARRAYDYVRYQPASNAREIAESVDEPALLVEQIILAMNAEGTSITRYRAVEQLIQREIQRYANEQAEAAHDHIMRTPA